MIDEGYLVVYYGTRKLGRISGHDRLDRSHGSPDPSSCRTAVPGHRATRPLRTIVPSIPTTSQRPSGRTAD